MVEKKNKINFYKKINYEKSLKYSEIEHSISFRKLFQIYEKR